MNKQLKNYIKELIIEKMIISAINKNYEETYFWLKLLKKYN